MVSAKLPSIFIEAQLPLIYANIILAFALGPQAHTFRVCLTLPILLFLVCQSLYREQNGPWEDLLSNNSLVMFTVFVYIDWILLQSPDREQWHKLNNAKTESNGPTKAKESGPPHGFFQRIWFGCRIATAWRYIGWSCQVKNVPMEHSAGYPRRYFIARKSLRALAFYLMKETLEVYTASTPHGGWWDTQNTKPALSIKNVPLWHQFKYTWVHIFLAYATLEMANSILGVVSVILHLATPQECPSAFGDLKDFFTVRKAWSTVWHQHMRRLTSTMGLFVARDLMQLRKGSFQSKYVQLFVGFGVSAGLHAGVALLCSKALNDDSALFFFGIQAPIIMLEDHVIAKGKSLGFKDSPLWRFIGFVWTTLAIGFTCRAWVGSMIDNGMWVHARKKDSVIQGLLINAIQQP
ncbi:hypothetical protein LEMA_P081880.1 [Plenodomus lingam JN3]|uniref:Wax synthase domain-containing protein n=1 Tax=Leptosphaeria maculans (strain JN3 / isolate v23.1.3 / race Av1-4-5-6-7-8) TaxID=985895 RepID=E5A5Q1_LEPMJ|nr:hypothetical protein LEMA_P081880.1 [Plenodomus lingam JN3]CBX98949.1 hypothetical protein LEMA_P081880.1 [Plenodomus lingam JN3]